MSLYKQGEIWWYEFTVSGKRFRSSCRTTDKVVAEKVEAEHRDSLIRTGKKVSLTLHSIKVQEAEHRRTKIWEGVETRTEPPRSVEVRHKEQSSLMPKTLLLEAGDLFLRKQREVCRPKTLESNEGHLQRLVEFFGNIPLSQFTSSHFEHYQSVRGTKCAASTVNHELNTLSRILRKVDLWYPIKRNYTPLKDNEWKPPRIFTAAEPERIFRALQNHPDLELANIVFTITRNTTASGCELRGLRLSSLELDADPPRLHVPPDSTKNNIRPRSIPLNEPALAACKRALERAKSLGCHYPGDYLFPYQTNRALWDPRRPASKSWLRKQITHLRKVTGVDHINPHVFRHLAVTELLEKGAKEQTVIAVAGWVGRRMIEHYSHPRMEAKADAVGLLEKSGHMAPDRSTQKPASRVTAPQTAIPDMSHPAVQAEIARQVELIMQGRRGAPRAPERRLGRRRLMMHGRRMARGPISRT
jgi:integrase